MENHVHVERIGDNVCVIHNGNVVAKENVFSEDYAWTIIRDKARELRNQLGI